MPKNTSKRRVYDWFTSNWSVENLMHLVFFGRRILRKTRGLWIQGLWWLRIRNPLLRSLPTTSLLQPLSRSPYALKLTRLRSSHILIYLVYLTAILYAPVSSVLSRNKWSWNRYFLSPQSWNSCVICGNIEGVLTSIMDNFVRIKSIK